MLKPWFAIPFWFYLGNQSTFKIDRINQLMSAKILLYYLISYSLEKWYHSRFNVMTASLWMKSWDEFKTKEKVVND